MASSQQPILNNNNKLIHVTGTLAPLFGGSSLSNCVSVEDPTCVTGNVAAAAALRRHQDGGLFFYIPFLDRHSQFVQSHPLKWSVNRLIFGDYFGYQYYNTPPAILLQDRRDFDVSQRDLSGLQSDDFRLLLTNANVPPTLSWYPYVDRIFYHEETSLATMNIMGLSEQMSVEDPIAAVQSALDEIARKNQETGCRPQTSAYEEYLLATTHHQQQSVNSTSTDSVCWIPVLYFSDRDSEAFAAMLEAVRQHSHPPAFVFDGGENANYLEPTSLETPNAHYTNTMWVYTTQGNGPQSYYQTSFHLTNDRKWIESVDHKVVDLLPQNLPQEILQDPQYIRDFDYIRGLVREAEQNDPVVGQSTEMPASRVDEYRRCKGGECELGNLFADALRWKANADVAFITSGGLRGSGWDEGSVRVSQIWAALPFPNTICQGVITGINLFRVINYSIGAATFQTKDTTDGGRLMQVSGMKIVYNTQLDRNERVISISIWDTTSESYQPIDRLRLYKFATDSFLCAAYTPFPDLLSDLTLEGEVPGKIGDDVHQGIVEEYLTSLEEPYQAVIEGRLTNDTFATTPMNLIQTEDACPLFTYWVEEKASCLSCPSSAHVAFSDERLEFHAVSGTATLYPGRIVLVNRELDSFHVVAKSAPEWLSFSNTTSSSNTTNVSSTELPSTLLNPGDSMALDFTVSAKDLATGTASGTVSFGVLEGSGIVAGCTDNADATFDVTMRVTPAPDLNLLGNMMYFGFVLMGITLLAALAFATWTHINREVRIVKTMQPLFLQMICAGVAIMSLAMVSLSLDDGLVSHWWCDFGCMSMPWFISMGWTITFAAIHAKLWRINRLFSNPHFRRVVVSEKDALVCFAILFGFNFIILLLWSLLDPLEWDRRTVPGEDWNTYGTCTSGKVGTAFAGLAVAVNVSTLCLAAYQAYQARNISGEFSETKKLILAVYTWLQVVLVGLPVLFLIDPEDVLAQYFIEVALLFCLCTTMMLNIFLPIIIQKTKLDRERQNGSGKRSTVRITGLNFVDGIPGAISATQRPSNPSSLPLAQNLPDSIEITDLEGATRTEGTDGPTLHDTINSKEADDSIPDFGGDDDIDKA